MKRKHPPIAWYDKEGNLICASSAGSDDWIEEVKKVGKLLGDWDYRCIGNEEWISNGRPIRVSTIWLGLDNHFCMGEDCASDIQIFETMVFISGLSAECKHDECYMKRYATEKQAKEGHEETVRGARFRHPEDRSQ